MKSPNRKLVVEGLETREMLASIQVVDNVLQIFGDDNDDRFTVTQGDEGIRVSSPRLNGSAFGFVEFDPRSFRSIDVRLFEGLDSITFEQVELSQSIRILGGEGIDVVRFSSSSNLFVKRVPESVVFQGGGGRDEFISRRSFFNEVTLNLGEGTGFIGMDETTVLKEFSAFMGGGDDTVNIDKSEFRRFVKIDTGEGGRGVQMDRNEFFGSLRITNIQKRENVSRHLRFRENTVGRDINFRLGDGPDEALLRGNFIEGNVRISGDMSTNSAGGGDNEILVYNNTIEGNLSIVGGVGDDEIRVRATELNELFMRSHRGDDKIVIQRIEATKGFVATGEGNDSFLMEFSRIKENFQVIGQTGDDTIYGFANEIVATSVWGGGAGRDRIFAIQSEFGDKVELLGQADDDDITAFNNSFLSDAALLGGAGNDGYSAGLGLGEESNFFGGALDKRSMTDIPSPDFRSIRQDLRS